MLKFIPISNTTLCAREVLYTFFQLQTFTPLGSIALV